MKKIRNQTILKKYVVRIANGNRILPAFGVAAIVLFPKTSMKVAELVGIVLIRGENARVVSINGVGLRAYLVAIGLCTKIGM